MNLFTPTTENNVAMGIAVQTGGPLWRQIMYLDFVGGEQPEWHTLSGELDLSEVSHVPANIQVVKNPMGLNPTVNTIFYIDNFSVMRDGEVIASFDFENEDVTPFSASGTANISMGIAGE
jgi:hypothetical protein